MFGNMDLIDAHPRILAALKKAKLKDVGYLVTLSAGDLQRLTRLSTTDVVNLQAAISDSIPRTPCVTALQLLHAECPTELRRSFLSTGCEVLDQFLRGGILTPGLTEIAGESASGKTQLCLQLCLTVQLPCESGGLDSGAVYVCTEDTFPNRRLVQMATLLQQRCPQLVLSSLTDRIYVEHCADVDGLITCISRKITTLLSTGRIKLVIIDSIAGLFRGGELDMDPAVTGPTTTNDFFARRSKRFSAVASLLHSLSFQFSAPIVIVNQVSDVFDKTPTTTGRSRHGKTPALGLSWANMLTARLMMSRTDESVVLHCQSDTDSHNTVARSYEATVRAMEVLFAPHLPNTVCRIVLDEQGVKGYG